MRTLSLLMIIGGIAPACLAQSGLTTRWAPAGSPITTGPRPPGTVIHVPGDFSTIQAAIDASGDGDLLLVGPGTYLENLDFLGKDITVRSDLDADPVTIDLSPMTTIIDGSSPSNPNLGSVVSFKNGESAAAMLRGFTLTGGTGTYLAASFSFNGGGVFCQDASPTITENIIAGNTVGDSGFYSHGAGGIACQQNASPVIAANVISNNVVDIGVGGAIGCGVSCAPLITGNEISGNTALGIAGGGIVCGTGSSVTILNNTISNNTSVRFGGGIFAYECDLTVQSNIIQGNSSQEGGGIYCESSTAVIVNNVVAENLASTNGGGLNCYRGWVTLTNNTIYGNAGTNPSYAGGGLYARGYLNSSPYTCNVYNSIVYNNIGRNGFPADIVRFYPDKVVVEYSDVGAWIGSGPGNIDADPQLVDPAHHDWRLAAGSPCIDVGNNSASEIPATDFEGDARILDGDAVPGAVVDMGADERAP